MGPVGEQELVGVRRRSEAYLALLVSASLQGQGYRSAAPASRAVAKNESFGIVRYIPKQLAGSPSARSRNTSTSHPVGSGACLSLGIS
jgi:hypothetical protein